MRDRNSLSCMLQPHLPILTNMKYNYWNNIFPLFLFLFDYNVNIILNRLLFWTLLCWLLLIFYYQKTARSPMIISLLLLGLSSLLYYDYIGLFYISAIPAIIATQMTKRWFACSLLFPAIMLLFSLIINHFTIQFLLNLHQPTSCTIEQICVNIILLLIMSLKIHGVGRLGNRL
jgi:hypothetical protein